MIVPDISNSVTMKSLFVLLLTIVSKCIGFSFRNSNTCTHGRVLPLMMHPQSSTTQEDEAIEELMKKHDPILLFASKLLDDETARDASALYAWCRRLVSFDLQCYNSSASVKRAPMFLCGHYSIC